MRLTEGQLNLISQDATDRVFKVQDTGPYVNKWVESVCQELSAARREMLRLREENADMRRKLDLWYPKEQALTSVSLAPPYPPVSDVEAHRGE